MNTEETGIVIDALHSALVCLAGNPTFEVEERQVREALRVMGVQVIDSGGKPITEPPYVNETCLSCGGTDRVLADWEHNGVFHIRQCIACRRQIMRAGHGAN